MTNFSMVCYFMHVGMHQVRKRDFDNYQKYTLLLNSLSILLYSYILYNASVVLLKVTVNEVGLITGAPDYFCCKTQ